MLPGFISSSDRTSSGGGISTLTTMMVFSTSSCPSAPWLMQAFVELELITRYCKHVSRLLLRHSRHPVEAGVPQYTFSGMYSTFHCLDIPPMLSRLEGIASSRI